MLEIIFIVIGLIFFLGVVVLLARKRKKLSKSDFAMATGKIQNTRSLDPNHAVMECHKIFVATISTLFKEKENLTAAQVLQKVAVRFPNQQKIWSLHGLRNRVAHETDSKVFREQADSARAEFIRALESLV